MIRCIQVKELFPRLIPLQSVENSDFIITKNVERQ